MSQKSQTPIEVPDDAYNATTWNGNPEVPTKNAVRDKIETLTAGSGTTEGQALMVKFNTQPF